MELAFGHLESAVHAADVRRMHKTCGVLPLAVPGHRYGKSLMGTPVAGDISLARTALEEDPRLLCALCLMLLPDYSCAAYIPPIGCRETLQEFTADVERMRAVRDKRPPPR